VGSGRYWDMAEAAFFKAVVNRRTPEIAQVLLIFINAGDPLKPLRPLVSFYWRVAKLVTKAAMTFETPEPT
jgi:hypothetical protein